MAGKPDYEERTPLSVFPCNMNFFFVNYIKYTVLADRDGDFMTCLELLDSFFCIPVHTVSSVYILVLISPMLSLAQGCSALFTTCSSVVLCALFLFIQIFPFAYLLVCTTLTFLHIKALQAWFEIHVVHLEGEEDVKHSEMQPQNVEVRAC